MTNLDSLPRPKLGRYRHYKGGEYEVIGAARHSETLEPLVLYRPLYNESGLWVRPYAMFFEEIEHEGRRQPRFAFVEKAENGPPPGDSMNPIRHVNDVPGYPAPHSPYSHAVVANGFVFVSGQIAVRPGGGPMDLAGDTIAEQTRQALRNVKAILESAGSSMERVVKVTVLLARPELAKEMNEAYAEFFPGPKPARAIAKLGVEIPGVLVSIEAIAAA